jgi:hypothetical protein
MILNKPESDVLIVGGESHGIGVSKEDSAKLLYILTQGLYKDPITAICRELISNIVDSYIGCDYSIEDKPGFVKLTDKCIYFIDQGSGMSRETVDNVYSILLASTKENDSNAIGAWGLGSKTPWAYSDTFYVTTCKDKDKRTYMLVKDGLDSKIVLISEEEGTEDGTTVFINIDNPKEWDKKIRNVLFCFRHIHYSYEGNIWDIESQVDYFNKSVLIEGNSFFYRDGYIKDFCIALDQVIYNISLDDLGVSHYGMFPVAVKMSLKEGLVPTPSRDNLILNQATKDKIVERLKEAVLEIQGLQKRHVSLREWSQSSNYIKIELEEGDEIKLHGHANILCKTLGLPEFQTVNPLLKHCSFNDIQSFFKGYVQIKHTIKPSTHFSWSNVILIEENPSNREYKFLKEEYKGSYLIKKQEHALFYKQGIDKIGLYDILELNRIPKDRWREAIVAFLGELEDYTKTLNSWEKIESEYKVWEPAKTKNTRIKSEDKEVYLQKVDRRYSEWVKVKHLNNIGRKYLFVTKSEYSSNSGFLCTLGANTNTKTDIYICSETSLKYLLGLGLNNFYSLHTYTSTKFFKRWVNNSFCACSVGSSIYFPTMINIERELYKKSGKVFIRDTGQYEHLVDKHLRKSYNKIYDKYTQSPYIQASTITHQEKVLALVRSKKYQKLIKND